MDKATDHRGITPCIRHQLLHYVGVDLEPLQVKIGEELLRVLNGRVRVDFELASGNKAA